MAYCSLWSIGFIANHRPMASKMLNQVEVMNESLIMANSYFMLVFTEWVPSVEFRYHLGFYYMYGVVATLSINIGLIVKDMITTIYRQWKASKALKAKKANLSLT
mmetsp:Transcript_2427/g.3711  ORF Transcript_2427/g.3711 Transcript_2427/m.3711 type:complete len:105 (-) Transcript_2427:709-1023(-)